MKTDVAVLGAGIVGTSVALHLLARGRSVTLIDKGDAGAETSFGNAGLIQREGVAPHKFPQSLPVLLNYARNTSIDMRFRWSALPRIAPFLARYWWASRTKSYAAIVEEYARFIAHAVSEHAPLIEASGADNLIGKAGWMEAYRTEKAYRATVEASEARRRLDLDFKALDEKALLAAEPNLTPGTFVGGVLWTQPWTVRDPYALTQAYLALFLKRGGRFVRGDAMTLRSDGEGWEVRTDEGALKARDTVIALGPWSGDLLGKLGRRLPLGVKRGYHVHYAPRNGATISVPIYDEAGFVMAPMREGLRLTSGAEFAMRDAPPTPVQLAAAEPVARAAFPIGERVSQKVWMGSRPCTPDMKPVIGPEGRKGLWLALGHAHHGLTLGPATGRLLAEMMTGEETFVDPRPYRVDRFG